MPFADRARVPTAVSRGTGSSSTDGVSRCRESQWRSQRCHGVPCFNPPPVNCLEPELPETCVHSLQAH
eukprot:11454300-Alexandrium_andersonii.AAC.1